MAKILMLCHDQHLDRRILAQARTLISNGHHVHLLALAFDAESCRETLPDGLEVTRIGLGEIVPENPTYLAYVDRQRSLNDLLNRTANRKPGYRQLFINCFTVASKVNWHLYKFLLLVRYRNSTLADPLPFRSAFTSHGSPIQCNVIQVHDLPALEAGVDLAREKNVPLVYDAHELYPEQKAFSSVQRRLCADMEKRLIASAELVYAVNESIALALAERYGIAKPRVLLNVIDPPPDFDGERKYDLLRQKLKLSQERRILLFQGGFSPNRNLEALLDAISLLKTQNVDLVMMGFGDFQYRLEARSKKNGTLNRRIYFLPAVPQSELLQHSASADVGIIPYPHVDLNSYFCTPNKLFEFIQAGVPILANDSPELKRFVADNNFGLTAPMRTPHEIAKAIDKMFSSAEIQVWQRSLKLRRNEFTWSKHSDAFYRQFLTVLHGDGQAIPGQKLAGQEGA